MTRNFIKYVSQACNKIRDDHTHAFHYTLLQTGTNTKASPPYYFLLEEEEKIEECTKTRNVMSV